MKKQLNHLDREIQRCVMVECAVCSAALGDRVEVTIGNYRLQSCRLCGSWTLMPRPCPEQQHSIHDSEEYFEHPYFENRRADLTSARARCREIFNRISVASKRKDFTAVSLLDIGCDTGGFLRVAKAEFGVNPFGLDVSVRACAVAKASGLNVYCAALENAPAELNELDLITAIDLIEHLVCPRSFLVKTAERLRSGGLLYLETPNIKSKVYWVGKFLCEILSARPRGTFERLFPPQHLQYFTNDSLIKLAEQCGFEVLCAETRIIPGRDLGTSIFAWTGVMVLQALDVLFDSRTLLCLTLRKR